jgi:hypothetical protein
MDEMGCSGGGQMWTWGRDGEADPNEEVDPESDPVPSSSTDVMFNPQPLPTPTNVPPSVFPLLDDAGRRAPLPACLTIPSWWSCTKGQGGKGEVEDKNSFTLERS